ncbi:MAG: aminoglycoside phosphotransferase family protein [Ignavibacteria bacterium]|nr:aminoglycoside phosphotransferase family protein [Ignavibacteria bacterium]
MPIKISNEKVSEVIDIVNSDHGTNYELIDQFGTGEWGAYRIAERDEGEVVLKFFLDLKDTNIVDPNPNLAKKITERLRGFGYPTPKYLYSGRLYQEGLYWVQELLPGEPLRKNPSVDQVKKLLSLLRLQRNQAVSSEQNLSEFVKAVVFDGAFGKADKLKSYSDDTKMLLDQSMELAREAKELTPPNKDIVHGDFPYHQAMVKDNEITGIIDWQEAGCGDWLVDLTRLIYSLHDRPQLAEPIVEELKKRIQEELSFIRPILF